MKATDLMNEDWVQIVPNAPVMPNEYHRIDWIRTGEIGLDNRKIVTYPYIQPIPLTPEILEKNGFTEYKDDKLYKSFVLRVPTGYEKDSFTIQITLYKKPLCGVTTLFKCWGWIPPLQGGVNDLHICNLVSVHELQHALKLCGIEKEIKL